MSDANKKLDLYYNGKIIGYSIINKEKNTIESYITAPISEVLEIIASKKDLISVGFKESMEALDADE